MVITLSDDEVSDHKFIIMAKQMKTNPSQTMIQVRQISLLYYNLGKKASS